MKLIVMSGLPGSGKSTLAEGLSRILSFPVFSVDPIEAAMWRSGLAKRSTGIAAYDVAIALADRASAAWAFRPLPMPSIRSSAPARGLAQV